jgi:hypothetical protein
LADNCPEWEKIVGFLKPLISDLRNEFIVLFGDGVSPEKKK